MLVLPQDASRWSQNHPLKKLDLSRNVVGDGGAAALAEMIAADPFSQNCACNNGIRDEGGAALRDGVPREDPSRVPGHVGQHVRARPARPSTTWTTGTTTRLWIWTPDGRGGRQARVAGEHAP